MKTRSSVFIETQITALHSTLILDFHLRKKNTDLLRTVFLLLGFCLFVCFLVQVFSFRDQCELNFGPIVCFLLSSAVHFPKQGPPQLLTHDNDSRPTDLLTGGAELPLCGAADVSSTASQAGAPRG